MCSPVLGGLTLSEDEPLPINAYGLSKRLGEVGVLAFTPRLGWFGWVGCSVSITRRRAPMLAETENYHVEVGNVRANHTGQDLGRYVWESDPC